jgi:hypothetical protein
MKYVKKGMQLRTAETVERMIQPILSEQDCMNIDACAKRRGIGSGYFVIDSPAENGDLTTTWRELAGCHKKANRIV